MTMEIKKMEMKNKSDDGDGEKRWWKKGHKKNMMEMKTKNDEKKINKSMISGKMKIGRRRGTDEKMRMWN